MNLNLGSCDRHFPGYISVDLDPPNDLTIPHVTADLDREWPWDDSSIDEIRAYDVIEHLRSHIHTMNEAWRVLKPSGKFDIIVPTTDGRGAWQDPGHVSFWNRNSFFYFEAGNPHLTRFSPANGVRCAFRICSEQFDVLADQVSKLHIILEAVK